jgi:cysteine desulfurase
MHNNSVKNRHYFDWAATAVPEFSLVDIPYPFANPSSLHYEGNMAAEALEAARIRCASVLNIPPETVYFTSGGTEANCIPIFSCLARKGGGRIIASFGEHSSVTENLQTIKNLGRNTGYIPIDSQGRVTPALLEKTIEKYGDVRFTAIMLVNNETGTINDMAAIRDLLKNCHGLPVHIHCDMVQAAGKIPVDIAGWQIDSASFSAHKIGGPRGIGLLYLRRPLDVLCRGGGQEKNIRPGTENVAGALALAACLENHALPDKIYIEHSDAQKRCKKLFAALREISRCVLIPAEREWNDNGFSPYIVQAAFKDIPGEVMTRALNDLGFAVSTGSACSSNVPERPVLAAMGIEDSQRLEGIRISQGWSTTDEEIDLLLSAIHEVLKFL